MDRAAGAEARRAVAMVVFGDPYRLPPTLNAADLLAARGFDVEVIGVRWQGLPDLAPPRESEGSAPTTEVAQPRPRIERVVTVSGGAGYLPAYLRFAAIACARALRGIAYSREKRRFDWIYAYDMMAAPVGRAMARLASARSCYHSHDLVAEHDLSLAQRLLRSRAREHAAARSADLVVLPEATRARLFAAEARLERPPLVAWNTPLLAWPEIAPPTHVPAIAAALARVDALAARFPRLVLYQGGLGADRGLDPLVDSVASWPRDAALVVLGLERPSGRADALLARARDRGVAERVLLLPALPYRVLPSIARRCLAGVRFAVPGPSGQHENVNHRHHVGAANKVFEYMASGLRLLASDGPGWPDLLPPENALLLRDHAPAAIAAGVRALLSPAHEGMGEANRRAFRERFHYERSFAPVVTRLESPRS